MELELNNKLNNKINNANELNVTKEKQNEFLETTLGKTINGALDIGLRWILPDLIENQVIEIKDTLLKNGLKDGIDKSIEVALDFGKSAFGIVTGKFDNISQIQTVVQKGGILDTISDSLDSVLNYTVKKNMIPRSVASVIKNSKNTLLDNIESNLQNTMTQQIKGIEKIDTAITNWNTYLKQENFEKMELEYQKVKEQLKELIPLETTLKKARELENLHLLIKNRGGNLEISEEEKELSKQLS
ncbi:MAG: hypothetical protein J6A04_06100 [Clostridia bacterium]|nr:hypothetical protein [Clostridia bacterium]